MQTGSNAAGHPRSAPSGADHRSTAAYRVERYGRNWAVYDRRGLVCVTLYRKGAREVAERLGAAEEACRRARRYALLVRERGEGQRDETR